MEKSVEICTQRERGNMTEVEVKLRLPDLASFDRVRQALGEDAFVAVHEQRNEYFDTNESHFLRARGTLRIRFYRADDSCFLTLKENGRMQDGIMVVGERETTVDANAAREFVDCPSRQTFLALGENEIVSYVADTYLREPSVDFIGLGGVDNRRDVYRFDTKSEAGVVMVEMDRTDYSFGTIYGLEMETEYPREAKEAMEKFLKQNKISFSECKRSKFATFLAGNLDE